MKAAHMDPLAGAAGAAADALLLATEPPTAPGLAAKVCATPPVVTDWVCTEGALTARCCVRACVVVLPVLPAL